MIEELISDNDSGRMPGHTKRIGRELAMLYLFSGELNKDHLTVERSEFYAEAANLLKWRENRQLRKGREYADGEDGDEGKPFDPEYVHGSYLVDG